MRTLLIQIRAVGDVMGPHEAECVLRQAEGRISQLSARNVFDEIPEPDWLDSMDALVIGGSGSFSVHDARSHKFVDGLRALVERALETMLPSFGICFGHQLLGLHLGADVVTDVGRRAAGTIDYALTEAGSSDQVFSTLPPRFAAHAGHTDHVMSIPAGATLLASADYSEIQAMRVDGAPFYSTQFHPDLTANDARHRYRKYADDLPEEERADLESELERFDQERNDARALLRHFLDVASVSSETD